MKRFFEALVLALVLVGHALLSDALTTVFTANSPPGASTVALENAQTDPTSSTPPLGKQVENSLPWPIDRYPQQTAEVLSGLLAVATFAFFLANETGLRRYRWLRRKVLMPIPGGYEGYWASTCRRDSEKGEYSDNLLRLAISKIYYSKSRECWIHHGYEFDQYGKCLGEFKLESMYFSKPRGLWFFRGSTWRHEKGEDELYSERLEEKDQLSFISVAEKVENHIVSRYLDDPLAAGKWMQRSGRSAMVRLSQRKMNVWFPNFQGAIDHPSIRADIAGVIDGIRSHLMKRVTRAGDLED
jgi:hypothetical protein